MRSTCLLAFLALPALALTTGCTTVIEADLRGILAVQQFPVTQDATPDGSDVVGMVAARDTGFYPLGFIPVVPMSMQACIEELVRQAQILGGDGIARVTLQYEQPTSFLSFSVVFLPDWFGSVTVTGSVWRRRVEPAR